MVKGGEHVLTANGGVAREGVVFGAPRGGMIILVWGLLLGTELLENPPKLN